MRKNDNTITIKTNNIMDRKTFNEAVDIYEKLQSLEEKVASIKECVSNINSGYILSLAFFRMGATVGSGGPSLQKDIICLLKKLQRKYENEIADIKRSIR